MQRFKFSCRACTYSPKVRDWCVRPPFILESLLIQLRNTHSVLIGWNMLCHNIHSDLAEKHIRAYACRSRDTRCVKHILYQHTGKTVTVRVIGAEIARSIYENLVNRVCEYIFGSDIFEIYAVNLSAHFHVVSHLRSCNNIINSEGRILHKL